MGAREKVRGLLEHELARISELHYEAYFLTVWDLVKFCRDEKILVQGRGSAANSAVCYSLGITAVELLPVHHVIDESFLLLGVLGFFVMLIAAIVYAQLVVKGSGPVCKEITEETITLELPSQEAVEAISRRMSGGAADGVCALTASKTGCDPIGRMLRRFIV